MILSRRRRFNLDGKGVLLTGASSGIGRHLAGALAARGARLVIAARRQELLEEVAAKTEADGHVRPVPVVADLAVPGEAARLADAARDALGRVDVLVNNAGGGVGGLQWHVGDRIEGREAFEINVWSPLALVHALVPPMLERGDGAVVNVTSLAQVSTWPGMGHYAATKAAFATMTETLGLELQRSGVHVLEVIPGPVDTAVQGESRLAPGFAESVGRQPMGDPGELARLIVVAVERRKARLIYPGGRMRVAYALPGLLRAMTPRQVLRHVDPELRDLDLVVRSGSQGDPQAREARENWERAHGR